MINAYIPRHIYSSIKTHLSRKETTLLLGPRQCGKTTLLKKLQKELEQEKRLVYYFNLDIVADRDIVKNQTQFVRYLNNARGEKPCFVIIDEVQRLPNPGLYLKGIYDQVLPIKLIVSGSSSLEIKSKIAESMTGRKRTFRLETVSFAEYVSYKRPDLEDLKPVTKRYLDDYLSLLDEYINFGGYPRVILAQKKDQKIATLEEIYSSYIERDIKGFFQIKNENSFLTLVNLLAIQIGSLINKNQLAANTGSNRLTIDNYLIYLEKSFVIKIIKPYFTNPKKELLKSAKIYFSDLGLRNLIVKDFNKLAWRRDKGHLLENFCLLNIQPQLSVVDKLNHWRSKTKAEVDFVIKRGGEVVPVEIKASQLKKPSYSKSLRSFINIYQPKKAYIINLSLHAKEKIGSTQLITLPFYFNLAKL